MTTNGRASENRFLIQELNLDKIKEEIENWNKIEQNDTDSNDNVNFPSLFPGLKPMYGFKDRAPALSTPRNYEVNKAVEARFTWLDSLPKINMINVDKFYTQELDKIIELDQE